MAAWMKGGGHLQHNLKSEVVAQQAGVPKSHLLRWVKAQGYESFSVWINTQRVREAERLMATRPEYAVEDVADQCGISRTHFHSVFKQYNGLTPAHYLKRLRRTG